jgi:hypothetical protein
MPTISMKVMSTRKGQLLLSAIIVALLLLVATIIWENIKLPVVSQRDAYLLTLMGPVLGLSAHVSIFGVAVLSLPIVLLLWLAFAWTKFRIVVLSIAIVYWLALGAFFSIGVQ